MERFVGTLDYEGVSGSSLNQIIIGGPVAVKLFDHIKLADADEQVIDEIRKEAEMMEKLGTGFEFLEYWRELSRLQVCF